MGSLGKRPNKHYAGSTTGDSLWPVAYPKMDDLWKLSVGEKKTFYEKAARAAAPPDEDEEVEGGELPEASPRQPGDIEPMNFWSSDDKLYSELMHRVGCQAVIDLTATDGQFALSAIKASVPYLGVCQTAQHAEALAKWLTSSVFRLFLQEGSPLHKPSLAEVVGSADPSSVEGPTQTTGPSGLQRTRARAKASAGNNARALRAAKRAARSRASRASAEEGAQEEQGETAGEGGEEEQFEEDQEGQEGEEGQE